MSYKEVKVPVSLLLDRNLTGSARLLWMILQLSALDDRVPISPGFLVSRSGLARHTVLRGLRQLETAGWLTAILKPPRPWVSVPDDLLHSRLGIQAKLLYAALQLTSGIRDQSGESTMADISCLVGMHPSTVKQAVRALQATGWLQLSQRTKFSPIHFTLRNPLAELRAAAVAEAEQRLERAAFVGEALMREYLSLMVDCDQFDDNASPGFLVNPYTGEEMQFDRYYPPGVAFEFNGPQHYGPTARYPNKADIRKQQGRDLIKSGICTNRGITLVIVHPEDLSLEAMRRKVEGLLPLRSLDGHEPLITYLESVSRAYRRRARRRS